MLIHKYIHIGWPDAKQLSGEIKYAYNIRDEIQVNDNHLYFGDRQLVPKSLRKFALKIVHITHLGVSKTVSKMKQSFYWPGFNTDVMYSVSAYKESHIFTKSKLKCLLLDHYILNLPFSNIGDGIAEIQGHNKSLW